MPLLDQKIVPFFFFRRSLGGSLEPNCGLESHLCDLEQDPHAQGVP